MKPRETYPVNATKTSPTLVTIAQTNIIYINLVIMKIYCMTLSFYTVGDVSTIAQIIQK